MRRNSKHKHPTACTKSQETGTRIPKGWLWWLLLLATVSCQYSTPTLPADTAPRACDSLTYLYERHYTWNTNLVLHADSIRLAGLPLKESYHTLKRGDRVVVAEFNVHPNDTVDSIWVKLAHTQEIQGWLRECDMKQAFVPDDSISEAIHLFSHTHTPYFISVLSLFAVFWLIRMWRRRPLWWKGFKEMDPVYPLLLCLLMAITATLYETMQVYVPDMWEHFYYNPTLSPFHVPLLLSLFLSGFWLFIIVLVATVDVLFRRLTPVSAVYYLLGIASSCICCYFFFILTTRIRIGYIFLTAFVLVFLHCLYRSLRTVRYRCGNCGNQLTQKGICPHCGTLNE